MSNSIAVLPTIARPQPVDVLGGGMFALKQASDIFGLTLIDGVLVSPRELNSGLNLASEAMIATAALRPERVPDLRSAPQWVQRAVSAAAARRAAKS